MIGGVAGALALAALAAYLFHRPSCAEVAKRVDAALQRGDVEGIWPYIPKSEAASMGVTKAQFAEMLRTYYVPAFARLGSPVQVRGMAKPEVDGEYDIIRTFQKPDGLRVNTGVRVVPSPSGPMAYNLLSGSMISAMIARNRQKSDRISYTWEIRAIQSDQDMLTKLGFKGMYYQDMESFIYATWPERLAEAEHRLAVIHERESHPASFPTS